MTDTCEITETTRGRIPDPTTGAAPSTTSVIYSGPCEFVAANTQARGIDSAGRNIVQQGAVLKLPVDAPGSADVRPGHAAIVHLSSHDPTAPPVVATIGGFHAQTFAASRRLPVEVNSNG